MAHATRSVARERGFTLIELMVALLLTGLVMTSVFGVLHDAMTARDHIHNVSQFQRTGPMILDMIEADVRAIAPFNVGARRAFLGRKSSVGGADADAFDFVALRKSTASEMEVSDGILGKDRFLQSTLCEVGYHLKQNRREPVFLELWRREDLFLDEEPFSGGVYTKVYDKITNFKVTYYSEAGPQVRAEDHWSTEELGMFPQRMKVEFEIEIEPRVESVDRKIEFSRRRSFSRVFNIDPDINRVLVANVRPLLPDTPKEDTNPQGGGPGGGGVPGGPGFNGGNNMNLSSGGGKGLGGGKTANGLPFNGGNNNKQGGSPIGSGKPSGPFLGGGNKGGGLPPGGGLPGGFPGGGAGGKK
jgi:prepilin-type N-terminal cleavage/methylation domain-containing protein